MDESNVQGTYIYRVNFPYQIVNTWSGDICSINLLPPLLIENHIHTTHPFRVNSIRSMMEIRTKCLLYLDL